MEPEPEERPSIEYMNIVLDENFEEWLIKKAGNDKYKGLKKSLTHFRKNGLIATFINDKRDSLLPNYSVYIKGIHDADDAGVFFDFYRRVEGKWGFGIGIQGRVVTDENGEMIEMEGKGYSRLLMAIMHYYLENMPDKPRDLTDYGEILIIGIEADASDGFWDHMGMKPGRYSIEQDRPWPSRVGAALPCFHREFQMKDWESWVFSDIRKRKTEASVKKKA